MTTFLTELARLKATATEEPWNLGRMCLAELLISHADAIEALMRAAHKHAYVDNCNNLHENCDLFKALAALDAASSGEGKK